MKNKFCDSKLLTNEAAVEDLFVSRLIRWCGYSDENIQQKKSIQPAEVALGSKRKRYQPDYILSVAGKPRVVVDAKAPQENLLDWVGQCVSYCATINRKYLDENPVRFFVLTNGISTSVFNVDVGEPLLTIAFPEFVDGNPKFKKLGSLLKPSSVVMPQVQPDMLHVLKRLEIAEVNAIFSWCHQHIYKKDSLSQAAGFEEFVKLIFCKLLSDRAIRDSYGPLIESKQFEVPKAAVKFSSSWIEARDAESPNPMDALQFQTLLQTLEAQIRTQRKKRIFREGTRLNLHPGTIKEVVKKLEHVYLFGIDADLNGRLFETFLNATMRGKDLGQFFTPRSVAKLGTLLANPRVDREHIDIVLDGCCGTGGFLIDVLAEMWAKVDRNSTLSVTEKVALRQKVAEEAIFGVDIAQEPNLSRLARMNMYLHGDGGSSIYEADFLDKQLAAPLQATPEVQAEVQQLRKKLTRSKSGFADVVATNPPFAKVYERKTAREADILDEYELARGEDALKSSVMFFERYYDVLKVGGRLISVIDDGILSGKSFGIFRQFLRERFLVRAVVSLPGDAFQRSQARVKTSFIVLEKRDPDLSQAQGPIFKFACRYVGIDDPKRQRTLPIDIINRRKAREEVAEVAELFRAFDAGKSVPSENVIPPDHLTDRLDAKSFEPRGRMVAHWKRKGLHTKPIEELVKPVLMPDEDGPNIDAGDDASYLVVGYDGFAREGEEVHLSETRNSKLFVVRKNQIVFSNINAVNGSVCVVPEYLDGLVVTHEFTILETKAGVDPRVVWALLRSPEIRAELLIRSRGAGRTRVKWEDFKSILVPLPPEDLAKAIVKSLAQAEDELRTAHAMRREAQAKIETALSLASEKAVATLQAFKPPS